MKLIFTIFVLSITICGCTSQIKPDKDEVLLLHYSSSFKCEVIKRNGKSVNPDDYYCNDFPLIIDDFSEYYPVKRAFFNDFGIEPDSNDCIFMWDYGDNSFIGKLPKDYASLRLVQFLSDSVIEIEYQGSKFPLKPGDVFSDTIVEIVNEGIETKRQTRVFYIENYGLIKKENIFNRNNKTEKSIELGLDAENIAELMPEFPGGDEALYEYLSKNLVTEGLNEDEIANTKVYVQFVVDDTGQITMVRILRGITPEFNQQVVDLFYNMPKWNPGMNDGKTVAVKLVLPIHIALR
ncbi:MAG: energy transducer TonB [Bacteroidales bacterium]|nr:energy transducer TonB [Bacteroidales bacterium]